MKFIIVGIAVAVLAVACGGNADSSVESPTPKTLAPQATPTSQPVNAESTATPAAEPFSGSPATVVKALESDESAIVVDVRAATHEGFDRIVFEFAGELVPGYQIGFADAIAACGSGEPVELPGTAMLSVELRPSTAHTDQGESTMDVSSINLGGTAITKAESSCDFEAIVAWDVGVTGEQPFNVFELSEPTRLVIDIAQPSR